MASTSQLKWYENFKHVSWVLLVSSLIFLSLHWFIEEHSTYGKSLASYLFKDAGIAGLIALILNLSIEWINRKRHQSHQDTLINELQQKYQSITDKLLSDLEQKHQSTSAELLSGVTKKLFQTVYERNVDPEVFRQVDMHLLKAESMRRAFHADFKLRRFLDPATNQATNFVVLDFCNDFKVVNLTSRVIEADVAKALVDVTPQYKDHCYFKRVTIDGQEFSRQSLATLGHTTTDNNYLTLSIKQNIQPGDIKTVRIEYTKLAPLDYNEIVVTTIPMDGISLTVSDPEEFFTVSAVSLHPANEKQITPKDQRHLCRWEIESAILPGQGILMLWHPIGAVAALPPTST
ncbi:hypothetical protein [Hydrogenophaga taeniospiralis]|uniref:hypothetical protein n=1 Tax=Hydrogenophaga taeniospiralis TaxID=65656 RepID=UPI001CFA871B|nr:hypothetical protein [Hydrogenophaga taeniospiralis]UCU94452.1 hypothetical protein KI616_00775 [Hydrogenophaga taeniospiralis]